MHQWDWSGGTCTTGAAARTRQIDALAVDRFLDALGRRPCRRHLAVPPLHIDRSPRAKIKACHIPIDFWRQHRLALTVTYGIIAGKTSHRAGMLARHDGRMRAFDWQPSRVPGSAFRSHALDLCRREVQRKPRERCVLITTRSAHFGSPRRPCARPASVQPCRESQIGTN
jgi:hypothetical protein